MDQLLVILTATSALIISTVLGCAAQRVVLEGMLRAMSAGLQAAERKAQ